MSDTPHPQSQGVLLTTDDVRQWKARMKAIGPEIESLEAERDTLARKLEAASLFLDVEAITPEASNLPQSDVNGRLKVKPLPRRLKSASARAASLLGTM